LGKENTSKNKHPLKIFSITAIIVCAVICLVTIVFNQAELAEKRKELEELNIKIEEVKQANQEYEQVFEDNDINGYKLKMAIESMDYAYPNEIRFYDTSRN